MQCACVDRSGEGTSTSSFTRRRSPLATPAVTATPAALAAARHPPSGRRSPHDDARRTFTEERAVIAIRGDVEADADRPPSGQGPANPPRHVVPAGKCALSTSPRTTWRHVRATRWSKFSSDPPRAPRSNAPGTVQRDVTRSEQDDAVTITPADTGGRTFDRAHTHTPHRWDRCPAPVSL